MSLRSIPLISDIPMASKIRIIFRTNFKDSTCCFLGIFIFNTVCLSFSNKVSIWGRVRRWPDSLVCAHVLVGTGNMRAARRITILIVMVF